ncbi:MAG: tRNA pseudouridine(38-40) synthase TruA [Bacteroidales bacterium]|jgi:tRNA pseudouridine38-40 synthase|nr:tRNA pseudouridine(38-40) synthase TruA [Bacteroidales bacterium]
MNSIKTRYFIFLSYKGTSYHGWQVQPNSITVQKILDEALSTILSEKIATIGAGRTDTGVHASVFCAHFESVSPDLPYKKNLIYRLNRYLPKDIAVTRLSKVNPDAHARFSAVSRTYRYNISRTKNPFWDDSSWFIHGKIDVNSMNEACGMLINYSDFTSFSRLHSDNKTNICRIFYAVWEEADDRLGFTIKADRFLRNMVRAIVGTMIEIGTGKMTLKEFEEVITSKDRSRAGKSSPAKGLFLLNIEYPDELFSSG